MHRRSLLSRAIAALSILTAVPSAQVVEPPFRHLSITVDPLYPLVHVWQVTTEYRPTDHWSGAVVLGKGSGHSYFSENPFWQAGGQIRWYPFEPSGFDWLFLAEAVGGRTRYVEDSPPDESTDLSVSLAAGYKATLSAGFTCEAQLGAMAYQTDYRIGDTFQAWLPYLNFGIGWSF